MRGLAIDLSQEVVKLLTRNAPTLLATGRRSARGLARGSAPAHPSASSSSPAPPTARAASGEAEDYLGSLEVTTDGLGRGASSTSRLRRRPGLPIVTAHRHRLRRATPPRSRRSVTGEAFGFPLAGVVSLPLIGSRRRLAVLTEGPEPICFAIQPNANGLLLVQTHAGSGPCNCRLSLFDGPGQPARPERRPVVGTSRPALIDATSRPLGSDFLEVQSLSGSGTLLRFRRH